MITFSCPKCFQPVNAPDDLRGDTCLCPHCNYSMVLPSYASPDAVAFPPQAPTQPDRAEPGPAIEPQAHLTASIYIPAGKERGRIGGRAFGAGNLKHVFIAAVLTTVFYMFLFMQLAFGAGPTSIVAKFTQRGWTCYASVFLAFWSCSMLVGKHFVVRRRRASLSAIFIPDNVRLSTDQEIEYALTAARGVAKEVKDTIIGHRIRRALEHFRATWNIKEVGDILREESEADFAELEASYALVRVFLWTIPILGFIGTVIGVGDAVGGFATFLSSAQEVDQIKSALTGVTSGLSVAFDTTFVALILSVGVMMGMSTVEKMERDQLQSFEDYCQNRILRRLPGRALFQQDSGTSPEALREAVRELIPDIELWKNENQKLAQALGAALVKAWKTTGQEWFAGVHALQKEAAENFHKHQTAQERMTEEWAKIQESVASLLPEMKARFESEISQIREVLETAQHDMQETLRKQYASVEEHTRALLRASEKLAEIIPLQQRMEERLLRAAGSDGLASLLADVRGALQSLDPALRRIADKPLDVEVHFSALPPAAGR